MRATPSSAEEEGTDLAAGLMKYLHLIEQVGIENAPLSELLAGEPNYDAVAALTPMQPESPDIAAIIDAQAIGAVEPAHTDRVEGDDAEATGIWDEEELTSVVEVTSEAPTAIIDQDLESVVAITEFCYSGSAALQRAVSLRADVRTALETGIVDEELSDLFEEIFDLVQLGLDRPA